jgi:hypothetical protein
VSAVFISTPVSSLLHILLWVTLVASNFLHFSLLPWDDKTIQIIKKLALTLFHIVLLLVKMYDLCFWLVFINVPIECYTESSFIIVSTVLTELLFQCTRIHIYYSTIWLFFVSWGGVRLCSLATSATVWPFISVQDDDKRWWMWSICVMSGKLNRISRRNYAQIPLCLPQIPQDITRARTLASAVKNHTLTIWSMAIS